MQHWLVKTEPEEFSFDQLLIDGKVVWDGVRNYQARNNLKKMKRGDLVFVYHSGKSKEIVGIAEVFKEYYPEPLDNSGLWVVVELKPVKRLNNPITLKQIKNEKPLVNMPLLKQSRLSVMSVSDLEYSFINKLSNKK